MAKKNVIKTYKVWLEIEALNEDGESVGNGATLGILPDCVGDFDKFEDAKKRVFDIVSAYGSETTIATSDCNPEINGENRRLIRRIDSDYQPDISGID